MADRCLLSNHVKMRILTRLSKQRSDMLNFVFMSILRKNKIQPAKLNGFKRRPTAVFNS